MKKPIVPSLQKPLAMALFTAVLKDDIPAVKDFLEQGVAINEQDTDGETALTLAARYGHLEIARLLIDKGADLEKKNDYGTTALIWAAYYSHTDLVYLLAAKGAKIGAENKEGHTALKFAIRNDDKESIRLLKASPKQRAQLIQKREQKLKADIEKILSPALKRDIPAPKLLRFGRP